jgi:hypothetical protein
MKKSACLLIGILGLSVSSLALAATQVYKWTDENGIVHYSESPPADGKAKTTTLTVHGQPVDDEATPAPAAAAAGSGQPVAKKKAPASDAAVAENKAQCDEWRNDIASLNEHGRVRVMQDDGTSKFLSDDEKQKRVSDDQQSLDRLCTQ